MMAGTPFIIGEDERVALHKLREVAAQNPVDMRGFRAKMETAEGKAAHMQQMTAQSVILPFGYCVTFSIETNHPCGVARHMSMSSPAEDRVPLPAAVWMAAVELGFVDGIERCAVWQEKLQGHGGVAINLVQPINIMPTLVQRGLPM